MIWTNLFIIPVAISFFWPVATVLFKRRVIKPQWFLCIAEILVGITMLLYMIIYRGVQEALYVYDYAYHLVSVCAAPIFFLFVCALTDPRGVSRSARCRVLLPAMAYIVLMTWTGFELGPAQYKAYFAESRAGGVTFLEDNGAWNRMLLLSTTVFRWFIMLQVLWIVAESTVLVHRFHVRFNKFYADRKNSPKMKDSTLVILCVSVALLVGVLYFLAVFRPANYRWYVMFVIALASVIQWFVGLYNYRLNYSAEQLAAEQRKELMKDDADVRI